MIRRRRGEEEEGRSRRTGLRTRWSRASHFNVWRCDRNSSRVVVLDNSIAVFELQQPEPLLYLEVTPMEGPVCSTSSDLSGVLQRLAGSTASQQHSRKASARCESHL